MLVCALFEFSQLLLWIVSYKENRSLKKIFFPLFFRFIKTPKVYGGIDQ